jgi:hypothetical protein
MRGAAPYAVGTAVPAPVLLEHACMSGERERAGRWRKEDGRGHGRSEDRLSPPPSLSPA